MYLKTAEWRGGGNRLMLIGGVEEQPTSAAETGRRLEFDSIFAFV
jgi:hypothetical protein